MTPGSTVSGDGGSILNALGIAAKVPVLGLQGNINAPAAGIGPLGALNNLSQVIAQFGLDWDGTGNPLADLALPSLDPEGFLGGLLNSDLLALNFENLLPADLLGNLGGFGEAFGFLIGIPEMLLGVLTGAF